MPSYHLSQAGCLINTVLNRYSSQAHYSSTGAIGTAVIVTVYTIRENAYALSNETILAKPVSVSAASDAYMFMLVISFMAFLISCFMPKKEKALQKAA